MLVNISSSLAVGEPLHTSLSLDNLSADSLIKDLSTSDRSFILTGSPIKDIRLDFFPCHFMFKPSLVNSFASPPDEEYFTNDPSQ